MDERGAGRDRPPRSRWARRAVLLGSIGAGLWLAGSLGHAAAAQAATPDPLCCPVPVAVPAAARTIVHDPVHTLLGRAPVDRPNPAVVGRLTQPLVLQTRAIAEQPLPVRSIPTRRPVVVRSAAPGRTTGPGTPARLNSTQRGSIVANRCPACRPGNGNQRSAPHPMPMPAVPGGMPAGGAGASIAAMALLAPANGHSDSPPGLRSGSGYRLPAPRSRTVPPTTRPG